MNFLRSFTADLLPMLTSAFLLVGVIVYIALPLEEHTLRRALEAVDLETMPHGVGRLEALDTPRRLSIPARLTLSSSSATRLQANTTANQVGYSCVVPDASRVFKVASGATSTSNGEGPFCSGCSSGNAFGADVAEAYAMVGEGEGEGKVGCDFVAE